MPRPEPLRALLVLRRIEAEAAKVQLMEAAARQERAAVILQRHAQALRMEADHGDGDAFSAWLPRARDAAEQAAATLALAEAHSAEARAAAAASSLAETATQQELQRQAGIRRAARLEREQHELGDITQARAGES